MTVLASDLLIPGWAEGVDAPLAPVYDEGLPCHAVDPEIFFSESMEATAQAQAVCATCPMARACLEGALSRNEPWGVWGGAIIEKGEVVAVRRIAGRPRTAA